MSFQLNCNINLRIWSDMIRGSQSSFTFRPKSHEPDYTRCCYCRICSDRQRLLRIQIFSLYLQPILIFCNFKSQLLKNSQHLDYDRSILVLLYNGNFQFNVKLFSEILQIIFFGSVSHKNHANFSDCGIHISIIINKLIRLKNL